MNHLTLATTEGTNATLEHHFMPFSANRDFKAEPRLLVRAEGMYYWNHRGERLLDGCAGLFTHAAGHCRRPIIEAVTAQLAELDYAPPFQFGHPGAFEFAAKLADLTPDPLNHVFFTNSGSEAVETALKLALAYQRARGQGQRFRLVGRERAYHGVNFGGLSVGGMVKNREGFGPGLAGVHHMRHTWLPEQRFSVGRPLLGGDLAEDLQRLIATHGGDTIAACIVEPIAGSTGVLVPPEGYLERLRAICDDHGILLIFDEVICGFGRTGEAFAAQSFDVTPDLMTLAKALTNGTVPMGAVALSDEIYEAITGAAAAGAIEFFHGHTYSGHPVATAAGLAALELYREEDLFARTRALSGGFLERIFALQDLDSVIDVRGYGLLAAVDLAPGEVAGERGYRLLKRCYEAGLVLRVTADTAILAPALITSEDEIDEMVAILRQQIPLCL
ncbi:MAG TPA: aminotransferase class III-fold pyridoxal phosphate-dependent enzyme [Alphaproteobacteria bacterium]|jgi:beta-alanine--pyruvate transaminase|nr:aminotransferase class III-fold pyridoxal phosphate-dependent enzyme [Alphaproteobacteria bacterium]